MLDRRQFAIASASMLATTFAGLNKSALAEVAALREKRLVLLGLNALARAPERSYFADGHRGASMISAHLMCQDNDFDDIAAARIVELFDRNWAPTKLCEPFPDADPMPDAIKQVCDALNESSGVLREVGHDAIFAMHAVKAFEIMPEAATAQRVDGVCNLIRSFKPWRDGPADQDVDPPPFTDDIAASRFILNEASDAIDRFDGFGQGFAGHMLTFGQSLVELAAMGHVEAAENGREAFRKYVTVTRRGPEQTDRKIKAHAESKLRPSDADYWQKRGDKTLGIGHVFKYPYAYYDLLHRANDPELAARLDAKAWQLF